MLVYKIIKWGTLQGLYTLKNRPRVPREWTWLFLFPGWCPIILFLNWIIVLPSKNTSSQCLSSLSTIWQIKCDDSTSTWFYANERQYVYFLFNTRGSKTMRSFAKFHDSYDAFARTYWWYFYFSINIDLTIDRHTYLHVPSDLLTVCSASWLMLSKLHDDDVVIRKWPKLRRSLSNVQDTEQFYNFLLVFLSILNISQMNISIFLALSYNTNIALHTMFQNMQMRTAMLNEK